MKKLIPEFDGMPKATENAYESAGRDHGTDC